ncbi:hypothetical protein B5K08_05705 [Rhizobium leguminosarum bv. trifolii]|nr:hypothetical protein B5K08_05705 [Rhizobium leguminosarum bv. trifolii]
MRHIPFAPFTGRRWRQPDEGRAAISQFEESISFPNDPLSSGHGSQGSRPGRTEIRGRQIPAEAKPCRDVSARIADALPRLRLRGSSGQPR